MFYSNDSITMKTINKRRGNIKKKTELFLLHQQYLHTFRLSQPLSLRNSPFHEHPSLSLIPLYHNNNNNNNKNMLQTTRRMIMGTSSRNMSSKTTSKSEKLNVKRRIRRTKMERREDQTKVMEKTFKRLKLTCLDDWLKVSPNKLVNTSVNQLLNYYDRNMKKLLSTIYPNYSWDFSKLNSQFLFQSNENQQKTMENLFFQLKLKTLDDWLSVPRKVLKKNLYIIYNFEIRKMLEKWYPNFPWLSLPMKHEIDKQREFMEDLFVKLKLKSMDEWMRVTRDKIRRNGGDWLVKYYKNEMKDLLSSIYPFHCWQFSSLKKQMKISSVDDHRIKFDQLFIKLNLKTLDDWLAIPKMKISQSGGNALISLYRGNLFHLLHTLYPNFPWRFSFYMLHRNPYRFFRSIENQRQFMDHLFYKLDLKSLDDWMNVKKGTISENGGRGLVERYKEDFHSLFPSLYPHFPWFSLSRFKLQNKITQWISQYKIREKKDWYRMPLTHQTLLLLPALHLIFPDQQWRKSNFTSRSKRSSQRLLFLFLSHQIYPAMLIFEDYFHPHIVREHKLELDIFIPALQIAMEYQGEHHYDDIPGGFAGIELFQERDVEKEKLASSLHIKIIYIPYWWDLSLSSLQTSLQSQLLI